MCTYALTPEHKTPISVLAKAAHIHLLACVVREDWWVFLAVLVDPKLSGLLPSGPCEYTVKQVCRELDVW